MEKEVVRLLVNSPIDRGNIIKGLVNAGYTVWVEKENCEEKDNLTKINYFICCAVRRMFE
jgi:hypothetical protein